jgi:CIC family chloride channel protein
MLALAAGGLVGWLTVRYAPDAPGSGIPRVKEVLGGLGAMPWRSLLPVKFAGGALGIGAGLSLGLEGPAVQMGACAGHAVAGASRVAPDAERELVADGSGAGLAAVFNAPLAGFIFTLEELRRPMSYAAYSGALVAVLCAVIVARGLAGQLPSFEVRGYPVPALASLPFVVLVGAAAGLLGVAFNRGLLGLHRRALRVASVPRWWLPGLVAAAVGLAGWWVPEATGGGHEVAQRLLSGAYDPGLLALGILLVLKYATTVSSYASGAPGGIFAPMLVLGAILGMIVSEVSRGWAPALAPAPTAFAVLGMAAVFTASVRAPLTGITLILEMTGEHGHVLSLSAACLTAYLVAEGLGDRPVYDALVEDDLARRGLA